MISLDHIAGIIQSGGCVVLGVGVTPERYSSLFQDATNQDYLVIGPMVSADTDFIASRIYGDHIKPKILSILNVEMQAYLIRTDKISA